MAAYIRKVWVVFELRCYFILVTKDYNFRFALELFHILDKQSSLFKVTNNKRAYKLFIFDVFTEISKAKTSYVIILKFPFYFFKFSIVIVLVNNIYGICDSLLSKISSFYISDYFKQTLYRCLCSICNIYNFDSIQVIISLEKLLYIFRLTLCTDHSHTEKVSCLFDYFF